MRFNALRGLRRSSVVFAAVTFSVIADAARRQPLRVGDFTVDANVLPGILVPVLDTDQGYAEFSAEVVNFDDAAKGLSVTPTPALASALSGFTNSNVDPSDHASANLALHCADRAAPRDPEFYYRDIQKHLATEPFYGPLGRTIGPCAFWPTAPIEPPTTVDNHHPVLMVGGTGDPSVPYVDQLVAHQALHGSRLVTLEGSFHHAQYLVSGNACVDDTVQDYLLGGPLPSHDLTCQPV